MSIDCDYISRFRSMFTTVRRCHGKSWFSRKPFSEPTVGLARGDSLNRSKSQFNPTKVAKKRNGLPYLDGEIKRLIKKTDKLHAQKDPTLSTN